MGFSLGKMNFCISALVKKGLIRVERIKNNSNKSAYLYHNIPLGLKEITQLTSAFLKIKLKEYYQVKKEIKRFSEQMIKMDIDLQSDPGLLAKFKRIL